MSHLMNTYARQPVAFVKGQGVWLWDEAGKKYLDALAGIAVNTLGHNHPRLVRALSEQVGRVIHTSNLFQIPLQEAAAERVCAITGLDEVFFCNSGCEANEAAIKIARKYGHERGVAEAAIVVTAAVIASGLPPNVEPWLPGLSTPLARPPATQAPTGTPDPSPFASGTTSGWKPACW